MKILYLTSFVLGDSGANAADIFPRLAAADPRVEQVWVADFPRNKYHIEARQGARYLRLEWKRSWLRHAARIARKCRRERIDVLHVFYRQQNAVLLILIRLWMLLLRCDTRIVMDHRSVNLAKGWRGRRKLWLNFAMQICAHHLAGNPWAVETNHLMVFRPKHLIDLGYDTLPDGVAQEPAYPVEEVVFWFIGTLKPRNRKSEFLLDLFAALEDRTSPSGRRIRFHVAGPARPDQTERLRALRNVSYHGKMPRADLYQRLRETPGIGLAYMNREFHDYAPSLKFAEYAIMRFGILASDTRGLVTQGARMNLPSRVRFLPEELGAWTAAIVEAAEAYRGLDPPWEDAPRWSYPDIFARQVMALYREITAAPPAASQQEVGFDEFCHAQPFDQQHIAHAEGQSDPRRHVARQREHL